MRKHIEDDEQAKVFEWAAWKQREHKLLMMLFHVPNGGNRNVREAVRLKRQGVKAGIPDIYLDVPNGNHLIKKGDWYMSIYLGNEKEVFNAVESGEFTGFSMAGIAHK